MSITINHQTNSLAATSGTVTITDLAMIGDAITERVQERLDAFARTRGYDNIVSACSYATSTHPKYGPEGRYCVAVREQTWDTLFVIEADVIAGERPMPRCYEDIESELPVLAWPA